MPFLSGLIPRGRRSRGSRIPDRQVCFAEITQAISHPRPPVSFSTWAKPPAPSVSVRGYVPLLDSPPSTPLLLRAEVQHQETSEASPTPRPARSASTIVGKLSNVRRKFRVSGHMRREAVAVAPPLSPVTEEQSPKAEAALFPPSWSTNAAAGSPLAETRPQNQQQFSNYGAIRSVLRPQTPAFNFNKNLPPIPEESPMPRSTDHDSAPLLRPTVEPTAVVVTVPSPCPHAVGVDDATRSLTPAAMNTGALQRRAARTARNSLSNRSLNQCIFCDICPYHQGVFDTLVIISAQKCSCCCSCLDSRPPTSTTQRFHSPAPAPQAVHTHASHSPLPHP